MNNPNLNENPNNNQTKINFLHKDYCQENLDQKTIKASSRTVIIYALMFFVLSSVIIILLQQLYVSINGITAEMLNDNHPLYNETISKISAFAGSFGNLITYIITTILVVIIMKESIKKDFNNLLINRGSWVVNCVLMGFVFFWIANFIASNVIAIIGIQDEAGNEQGIINMMMSNPVNLIAMTIATVLLAPILEELVFRKCFFNFFSKKLSPIWVVIVTGLIFGSIHIIDPMIGATIDFANGSGKAIDILYQFSYIFVYGGMGIAFGLTYQYSKRNIIPCIILHMINNFISALFTVFTIYFL